MPDSKEDIVRFHLYEIKKDSNSSMVQKKGKFSGGWEERIPEHKGGSWDTDPTVSSTGMWIQWIGYFMKII